MRPKSFQISNRTRKLIRQAVREDIGTGDVTTDTLIPRRISGAAYIEARQNGILCGASVVREVFHSVDPALNVRSKYRDGSSFKKGGKVFLISGRIQSILKAERVALNFLGRLSGIATLTHRFVQRVRGTRAQILSTRKTTPLWRELEKYAVRSGGGRNHRFGLWQEVLVKDNHWLAIRKLLGRPAQHYFEHRLLSRLRRKRIPVQVEVDNLRELQNLLKGNFVGDRILLDNFSIRDLRQAVQVVQRTYPHLLLEASGGVSLSNVRRIAETGVDRISVGALTHSAPAIDFSLELIDITTEAASD